MTAGATGCGSGRRDRADDPGTLHPAPDTRRATIGARLAARGRPRPCLSVRRGLLGGPVVVTDGA